MLHDIKKYISISSSSAFSEVGALEMLIEINALNDKKSGKIEGGRGHSSKGFS